jgi:hypothetical protein
LSRSDEPHNRSYGWLVSYTHALGPRLAASISWQNEGHVPSHHRDGFSPQLWARMDVAPQLRLALGAGPYRYFDTVTTDTGAGFADRHGWGMLYSAAATWRPSSTPWLYQLRLDRVILSNGIDSTRLTAGLGYRLERDSAAVALARRIELAVFLGRSIVNSFHSEHASVQSVELRHALGPLFRLSAAWIDEGDAGLVQRSGLGAQAWFEPDFSEGKLSLGFGLGPYFARDEARIEGHKSFVAGLFTMSASYALGGRWLARFSWSRVMTSYDRDADILLLGVGYRF